jgi:cell wall-associated NlpC family hydrolase
MAGRRSFTRRVVVAGVLVSIAAWAFGERKSAVDEPVEEQPLIPDSVAVAAGRGLDPPKQRTFRRKLATSLVFATIFCAGAALTAGAGNEVAQHDATPLAESAPADTPDASAPAAEEAAAATTVEAASVEAAPVEAAPVDAAPVDAAPVEAAPLDAAPVDAAPVDAAPEPAAPAAAPEPVAPDPSDATPAKAAPASEPPAVTAAAKPSSRAVTKRTVRKAAAPKRHAAPALAPIPFRALMFNPQAWLNDNPVSPTGASAVAISTHYLGVPYVWGGAVPATGFDCSGLTRFVYEQLGVQLPHYAAAQFAMFPKLDPSQLAPGDLVFFEPRFDGPGHVAVYAGGDQIIEAPHTGALVRYASLSGAAAALGFLGAVRPYAPGAAVEPQVTSWTSMQVSLWARPE